MPRSYSEPFLIELYKANPDKAGTAMALACVKANLPAEYVSRAMEVSRMTLYSWFRGRPIRHKNLLRIETFTDLVESDTAKGILPAQNMAKAKIYLEEMIGRKIDK